MTHYLILIWVVKEMVSIAWTEAIILVHLRSQEQRTKTVTDLSRTGQKQTVTLSKSVERETLRPKQFTLRTLHREI
ncbi:hypothetical protein RRG08_046149 [Elysia crispata]|uniref:Uncharacterized protein n=1 Tax=Elysia crispata TaxID=231223 RepID=A0AAE1A7M7_9GAST|nr:hypothetical protein RRG08_052497 [Elysia crispata]KAK3782121.1 hypothetical protein RRG08_046149 [Elysia crispata]